MKRFTFITITFLLFSFAACSSAVVNNSYHHSFDFTKFVSYKIVKVVPKQPAGGQMPSATFGLIKSAIDLEMARKSYGKNDQLADFGIDWHTALNDDVYMSGSSLKRWDGVFAENEKGMLIIDIIDLENNSVVWQGWKKNVLGSENLEEGIKEAVKEILSKFPPENPLGLE